MKTYPLVIIILLITTSVMGQNKKYVKTMQAAIESMSTAQSPEDFDPIINKFNRIGQAEESQWEPYYYAAQSQIFKALRIDDLQKKDEVLDQALATIALGSKVSENNAELIALDGFANMLKVSVDPGTRGQTLSPKIMAAFSKAMKLDPNNPRATLFMGQMQMGTALFFGTPTTEPCKLIIRSMQLFDVEKPNQPLAPRWGREMAMQYSETCNIDSTGGDQ